MSSIELGSGVVVFIPTCENNAVENNKTVRSRFFFIAVNFVCYKFTMKKKRKKYVGLRIRRCLKFLDDLVTIKLKHFDY